MNASLIILCLASLGMIGVTASLVTRLALPHLDRVVDRLAARHRARVWLSLAVLPAALGLLALLAALLPAFGLGVDHCLGHSVGSHHPHLCPHHSAVMPGLLVVLVATAVVVRVGLALVELIRNALLTRATARLLEEGSERRGDRRVFESAEPQAFVLGLVSPKLYLSRGLLALDDDVVAPAVAHERAHVRARDGLWRALLPVLSMLHLPGVAAELRARLVGAQELAADDEAARELGDPVRVAASLLALARLSAPRTSPGLSFMHGDLETRVRALLDPRARSTASPTPALALAFGALVVTIGALHDPVHHALETILGVLS
ncbi:MAG: M48 family metalloprotease [Myxococcales bacterium]|nr:M48 family metalloprotease [Myxococcales bacterium]